MRGSMLAVIKKLRKGTNAILQQSDFRVERVGIFACCSSGGLCQKPDRQGGHDLACEPSLTVGLRRRKPNYARLFKILTNEPDCNSSNVKPEEVKASSLVI